ncbi:hypothetical protein OAE16_01630 [Porticoccaceae bacterium]|nr:hypothetical protein [Porticoccaceae bacterium]
MYLGRTQENNRNKTSISNYANKLLATIACHLFVFAAVFVTSAHAELPSFKVNSAELVSPSAANSYYGSATTHTSELNHWDGTRPEEIKALAKGLGAGDLSAADYSERVYEYLWKNISTEFRYGLSKGAFGAMLDQSGTAFDQTHLMVELLREGGVTASYKAGTITLNASQFLNWTGLSNAKAACRYLADGGIPATVNGSTSASCNYTGNVTSVTLSHIWVSANSKLYDPAYKTHTFTSGIDLASAMSCGTDTSATCGSSVTTAALSGATNGTLTGGVGFVQNINQASVENQLTTYAINLQNHIQNTDRHAPLVDIIGGQEIQLDNLPVANSTLPYASSVQRTWNGDIPNQYRTTLRVQFDNIDKTLYADELAGIRLRLLGKGDASTVPTTTRHVSLYVEHDVIDTSTRSGAHRTNDDITLSANHPYFAKAAVSSTNGSYMDVTLLQTTFMHELQFEADTDPEIQHHFFSPLTITAGFGETGQGSVSHFKNKQQADQFAVEMENPTDPNHTHADCYPGLSEIGDSARRGYFGTNLQNGVFMDCLNPQVAIHAATFMAQNSQMLRMAGQINSTRVSPHHMLGSSTQEAINFEGAVSLVSKINNNDDEQTTKFSIAMLSSRLEGSISEQLYDTWQGGSALSMLTLSNQQSYNQQPYRLLHLNSSNVTSGLNVTTGYSAVGKAWIQSFISDGYTVVLPDIAPIGQIPIDGGTAIFYSSSLYAYRPNGERITFQDSNGLKGANSSAGPNPLEDTIKSTELTDYSQKAAKYYGVSDAEGTLTLSPPADIVTGSGNFPYSLPFQRSYSSSDTSVLPSNTTISASSITIAAHTHNGGAILKNGWKHNYQISITKGSDGFQGLGEDSALDAANTLAGLYVLRDLNRQTQTFQQHIAGIFTAQWWGSQLQNNMAVYSSAESNGTYVQLPNGNYNPPPGSSNKLVQSGSRQGPVNLYQKAMFDYASLTFQLTTGSGEVQLFDKANAFSQGIGLKEFRITDWNFPNGVSIDFAYVGCTSLANSTGLDRWCLKEVSNNLGRKLTFDLIGSYGIQKLEYRYINSVSDENGKTVSYAGIDYNCFLPGSNPITGNCADPLTFNVTLPDGGEHRYQYDIVDEPGKIVNSAKISQWFTPEDHTNPFVQFAYDDQGRVESVTNANNQTTNYRVGGLVNENYRRSETINALGQRTQTVYNDQRKATASINPLGQITSNEYDPIGRLTKTTFPELNAVEYQYDLRHNRTQTKQKAKPPVPGGGALPDIITSATYIEGTSVFTCSNYKTCNKTKTSTDAKGNTTSYAYQSSTGNLLTQTQPSVTGGAPITTIAYNSYGQVSQITDPEGMISLFTYDSTTNHSVLKTARIDSANLNLTSTFNYDITGNVTSINGPRTDISDITNFEYDSLRRVTKAINADGTYARNIFDLDGLLKRSAKYSSGNALLQVSETDYTATGQVYKTYGPECFTSAGARSTGLSGCDITTSTYDNLDRPDIVTDGQGRKVKTTYDALGRPVKTIRAYGSPLQQDYATYTYTVNGQQANVKDANGNLTDYIYDGHDRLQKFQLPHPTSVGTSNPADYEEYSYDNNGNITTKRTRDNKTIVSVYDALNRVTQKAPQGQTAVNYVYDKTGRQTQVKYANNSHTINHSYDTAGRLTSTNDKGKIIGYQYADKVNRTRITWPDGYYAQYAYDPLNRVSTIKENNSAILATYSYDSQGRRDSLTLGNGTITSYSYHKDDALQNLSHNVNGSNDDNTWTYGFNKVNQLTSKVLSNNIYGWVPATNKTDVYQKNGLNQYTNIASNAMSYDPNGNLTGDGIWTYGYDTENMLKTATKSGSSATFNYDPLGRRANKIVNGTTTNFLHDGVEEIADYSSSGTLLRRYVHGPGVDEYLLMYTGTGTSNKSYYHANHQGSIVAMSNGSGNVTEQHSYSSYGESDDLTGNPFRYTGRRLDPETGLYYYRARYYSPAIGRFLQTDPIGYGDGLNWYAYVGNDPLNVTDPTGAYGIPGAIYGAIAGATGGYIASGGSAKEKIIGTVSGAVAGGAVGFVAPQTSHVAGLAAAGAVASATGQAIGSTTNAAIEKGVANVELSDVNVDIGTTIAGGIGAGAGGVVAKGVASMTAKPIVGVALEKAGTPTVTGLAAGAIAEGAIIGGSEKAAPIIEEKVEDLKDNL